MEPQEVDTIIRHLAATIEHQRTINDDIRTAIQEQRGINERLTTAIERIDRTLAHVEITQARVETLLARMIRQQENGRDA